MIRILDRELRTKYEKEIRTLVRSNILLALGEDSNVILDEFFDKSVIGLDDVIDFSKIMQVTGRMNLC